MHKIKFSYYVGALIVLSLLLQAFPVTVIPMMLIGAPVWTGLLVNLMIVLIGIEAYRGIRSREWLLVPAVYLIFFYCLYIGQLQEHNRFQQESRAANAALAIPFDETKHALLLKGQGYTGYYTPFEPAKLLAEGKLGAFYRSDREAGDVVTRIAAPQSCPGYIKLLTELNASEGSDEVMELTGLSVVEQRKECRISFAESPDKPFFTVTTESHEQTTSPLKLERSSTVTALTSPEGATHRLVTGYSAPLLPLPLPEIGCVVEFSMGVPRKECFAAFRRGERVFLHDEPRDLTVLLANLLELKPAPAQYFTEEPAALAERMRAKIAAGQLAILRSYLAAPDEYKPLLKLSRLLREPALAAPHAPAMAALLRAKLTPKNNDVNLRTVAQLAALLPDETLIPHLPMLREALYTELRSDWTGSITYHNDAPELEDRIAGYELALLRGFLSQPEQALPERETLFILSKHPGLYAAQAPALAETVKQRLLGGRLEELDLSLIGLLLAQPASILEPLMPSLAEVSDPAIRRVLRVKAPSFMQQMEKDVIAAELAKLDRLLAEPLAGPAEMQQKRAAEGVYTFSVLADYPQLYAHKTQKMVEALGGALDIDAQADMQGATALARLLYTLPDEAFSTIRDRLTAALGIGKATQRLREQAKGKQPHASIWFRKSEEALYRAVPELHTRCGFTAP